MPRHLFTCISATYQNTLAGGSLPEHLPDNLQEFLSIVVQQTQKSTALITHCRSELIHEVWRLLLDSNFMHPYKHGIIIKCFDGIFRRFYPQILTYSADYPEKVMLAAIRDMGKCPCPCCLVQLSHCDQSGLVHNLQARLLQACVYIAGKNAFAERLSPFGFDSFQISVVDLMHEFELGVWKSTFTHLICLLFSISHSAVADLDARYRQILPFGQGTIRAFVANVFQMRKLAARNFEDILQHALAKLHIHTKSTLELLDTALKALCKLARQFWDITCSAFKTTELPREKAACLRRLKDKPTLSKTEGTGTRNKVFNLGTYKFHALADYVRIIRLFGCTDSYTTRIAEFISPKKPN
ncbi:hypothetical protein SERLADRAFT_433018 [Serpula lacrymans var. lacrymans S7.9]|uniref:Uncharacterized protein n=1 Tax=Serpula lacrymans var. lacrymans (strain S7.9) TaxID=578457 RepID=F8NIW9_SERL9|nr:uncharacterized protein SERLADRAFT_433018 [Serpula lacrymans var. lacrymans S7.9]EGO29002.1 hypothetical protein SERLADRAFT_433018 [Serpula lacrymans var. lacrymans S7.9]